MSVELWQTIFDWGTVVLLGLTFAFGAGALITGNILNKRQADQLAKTNQLAADANERAAKLEKEAAGLKKEAEDERLARAELEAKVAWRRLNPKVQSEIASHLNRFAREPALIAYNPNDVEASSFASDIATTLRRAHWVSLSHWRL